MPGESERHQGIAKSIMKPILYRVETYIVPESENLSMINKIDDLKITNQFNTKSERISENNVQNDEKYEEFAKVSVQKSKLIGIKLVKGITNEDETPRDEHTDNDIIKYYNDENFRRSNERVQKTEFQSSVGPEGTLYPARQFSRINSLNSIDEISENSLDIKLNNFCCHGQKNGCTVSIPSPKNISVEIFKENWIQKIEALRNREAILREREMNLQKKERVLFRKEKELRITERILNDKMRKAEQYLKHKSDILVEDRLEKVARILSGDVEEPDNFMKEKISRKEEIPKKEEVPKKAEIPKIEEIPRKIEIPEKEEIPRNVEIPEKEEIPRVAEIPKKEETLRNAEIPKKAEFPRNSQLIVNPLGKEESNKKITQPIRSNSSSMRSSSLSRKSSSRTHTHSYATIRHKTNSKINYDDLNSTLSAASVDTPNVRTSVMFDPTSYKKPYAFTRSPSERWIRQKDTVGKLQRVTEEKPQHVIEKKIFQKVSDNICALQEKETRFQNYGLVDVPFDIPDKAEYNPDNEDRLSAYLDLEIGNRHSRRDLASLSKDRPISWASETNERLQKKQQVYSSMAKPSAENKENTVSDTCRATEKKAKKTKSKKFFLFR